MIFRISFLLVVCTFASTDAIVGGVPAQHGQFPFFTFMALISNETMTKGCGGSLIHPNWVLTAAHCFDLEPKHVILHFGFKHFFDLSEHGRTNRVVTPENFFVHPQYDSNFIRNDIALIRLPVPVKSSNFIRPIDISDNLSVSSLVDGIVIGKGRTEFNGPHSNLTYFAPMRATNILECLHAYPELVDRSTVFCASGKSGESTCYGDSGGPLIDTNKNSLVGIFSFLDGDKNCADHPQVFTKVAGYTSWISEVTGLNFTQS